MRPRQTTHIRGTNYARYLKPDPWWRRHSASLSITGLLIVSILLDRLMGHS